MRHVHFALTLVIVVILAFAVSAKAQEHDHQQMQQEQRKVTYTCPMHPDVVSDKPGECWKCGMTLVKRETLQAGKTRSSAVPAVKEAKRLLAAAKGRLAREGKYDCCIEESCNECLLDEQECSCHHDLKNGKAVCNECWTGWQKGEGKDKSVDPKSVRTSFAGDEHGHD